MVRPFLKRSALLDIWKKSRSSLVMGVLLNQIVTLWAAIVERDVAVGEVEGMAAHLALGRAFVLGRGDRSRRNEKQQNERTNSRARHDQPSPCVE